MELPTYQFMAQVSAALAVVISLGFVAYELKLSRDIAKAEVYQERTAMDQAWRMHLFDPKAAMEANRKHKLGHEITEGEMGLIVQTADIAIMSAENVSFQYQLGLLDEGEWSVWKHNMEWMLTTPCYREYFEDQRAGFRRAFAEEVEKLYSELPEIDCPIGFSE